MKVCFLGVYQKGYSRNDILLNGLEQNNVEIIECRAEPNDKFRYPKLICQLLKLRNSYDLIYAAFPGQMPAIVAKIFSRKKVVIDAFFSMYDAVVFDRQEISKYHPRALKLKFFDWLSMLVADMIIVDTLAHKKFFTRWKLIKAEKIKVVYVGVNDLLIKPVNVQKSNPQFLVHFHGSYLPLQGIDKIIEAANILRHDPTIKFRLVGSGQEFKKMMALIEKYNLKEQIEIIDYRVPYSQVNALLNEADVVLGIFGETPKANRVIPNKVYEGLAVAKPIITKESPAIRELFSEEEMMIVPNTGQAIAKAILRLKQDNVLREKIAKNGYCKLKERLTQKTLGQDLVNHLKEVVKAKNL